MDVQPGVSQVYIFRCYGCPAEHQDEPILQPDRRRPSYWSCPEGWADVAIGGDQRFYCPTCTAERGITI